MTYDLLIAGGLDAGRLAAALAAMTNVPVEAVGVADEDVDDRNWDAAVLCTVRPMSGDIRWVLDIYLRDTVPIQPSEADAAAYLADSLAVPVLYPAESYPPSAYRLVAPDGVRTRARVYAGADDQGDGTCLVIDAVEQPVPALPGVRVEPQPEVIKQHRMATPVADEFEAWLATQVSTEIATSDPFWYAGNRFTSWESLTARMTAGWPPDGWYPLGYYRDDLKARDDLAADIEKLPPAIANRLTEVLARVDDAFRAGTREVDDPKRLAETLGDDALSDFRGWWWRRLPYPEPWQNR